MALLVSSLIKGMQEVHTVAAKINALRNNQIGLELIAFTHDEAYWQNLQTILPTLTCPVTFHGPYIKTEGTASDGSQEQAFLVKSYKKTLALAKHFKVRHVVYHMTQLNFSTSKEADTLRPQAEKNALTIMSLAKNAGVPLLIENLPCPYERMPLYTNEQYFDFFARYPKTQSIIDVGHAHMTGLDLQAFLATYGDRIKAYHFHNNYGKKDEHNDIFAGTFSYRVFAALFKQYTPHADIVLEYEPHVQLSWEELQDRFSFILENYFSV